MRKRSVLVVGLTVVVLAGLAAAVAVRPRTEHRSVRETAQAYFTSQTSGDAPGMCATLTSEERQHTICEDRAGTDWAQDVRWLTTEIDSVDEGSGQATVHYRTTDRNPRYSVPLTHTGTLKLIRVGDDWQIDDNEPDDGSAAAAPEPAA